MEAALGTRFVPQLLRGPLAETGDRSHAVQPWTDSVMLCEKHQMRETSVCTACSTITVDDVSSRGASHRNTTVF